MDPEMRYTASGTPVCNFRLATNERWEKNGEQQERTEFHRIVAWSKAAERCAELLQKGTFVKLAGSLRTRSWNDRDGNKRYATEVHVYKIEPLAKAKQAEPVAVGSEDCPF